MLSYAKPLFYALQSVHKHGRVSIPWKNDIVEFSMAGCEILRMNRSRQDRRFSFHISMYLGSRTGPHIFRPLQLPDGNPQTQPGAAPAGLMTPLISPRGSMYIAE
jgi:hypothetical protein